MWSIYPFPYPYLFILYNLCKNYFHLWNNCLLVYFEAFCYLCLWTSPISTLTPGSPVAFYLECRLHREAGILLFEICERLWTLHSVFGIQTKAALFQGKRLTFNGSIFDVFPKYFGPEWRTGFNIRDCQGRQWARQADMTHRHWRLLLFPAFLCMSLRESLLTEEAFPVTKDIFTFAALNASEGLRHETKWGVDDHLGATHRTLRFTRSENRSRDLHPAYEATWPSA